MVKKLFVLIPLAAGILWGAAGVFVRTLTQAGFDSYTLLESRMAGAAIMLFLGLILFKKDSLKVRIKDLWLFAASGLLGMFGLTYFYNEAISQLTMSLAAVLLGLSPIFVMVLAAIFFKEQITKRKAISVGLAIIGCILVSRVLENQQSSTVTLGGITCGIIAAFCYAIYSILSKLAMERGYNAYTITFYSVLGVAICMLPFTSWNQIGSFVHLAPLQNILYMMLHSLCTSVLPYILYTYGLKLIDAGRVSIIAAGGEPAAAMIFGIVFYAEIPSILAVAGLVITIVAIGLMCLSDQPKKEG